MKNKSAMYASRVSQWPTPDHPCLSQCKEINIEQVYGLQYINICTWLYPFHATHLNCPVRKTATVTHRTNQPVHVNTRISIFRPVSRSLSEVLCRYLTVSEIPSLEGGQCDGEAVGLWNVRVYKLFDEALCPRKLYRAFPLFSNHYSTMPLLWRSPVTDLYHPFR